MTETKWLTADQRRTWVRFSAVLELLPSALDTQLSVDEGLTHFDYFTLAMLSEAPGKVLRMTALAQRTNSTLPRLSRVISRLEAAGFVKRSPCLEDRRATNATLTEAGWAKVQKAAPGHVETVRAFVIDALSAEQLDQLGEISRSLLLRLDPEGKMLASSE